MRHASRTRTYAYDVCSVCDRLIRALKDGTIGRHGSLPRQWPPRNCPGYGRKPKGSEGSP